jgi:acetyl-CoA synthase
MYSDRDDKIGNMTDEDVEDFYSCTLCQSYAPDHVCIVTPQRLGLCGAYTWLDCKASYQIDRHGPNEPVTKGAVIDAERGSWQNINEYIEVKSNGNLKKFNAYSMMEDPMTSCGCFECIAAIVPEANGILIVDRDFTDMTPVGMSFSTLAGQIGGGIQTPGFIGIGKLYISSPKFISAEGGHPRITWMPKQLKDEVEERLRSHLEKMGMADLFDKIATEEDAEEPEALLEYLQKVGHPALEMDPMF